MSERKRDELIQKKKFSQERGLSGDGDNSGDCKSCGGTRSFGGGAATVDSDVGTVGCGPRWTGYHRAAGTPAVSRGHHPVPDSNSPEQQ